MGLNMYNSHRPEPTWERYRRIFWVTFGESLGATILFVGVGFAVLVAWAYFG